MSDVHSNPAALETALGDARAQGCGKFILLGDITGYGYDAKKALGAVRKAFDIVLLGNHDSACLGRETSICDQQNPNYDIDRAQRLQLTKTDLKWLGARKFLMVVDGMALAHGDFASPESWGYIIDERDALESFLAREEDLMFCGHTHEAAIWELTGKGVCRRKFDARLGRIPETAESVSFTLNHASRYIVNVGSVGYPRHDYCSSYGMFDTDRRRIAIRRLPFDFKSYFIEMVDRGLQPPGWLCRHLSAVMGRDAE